MTTTEPDAPAWAIESTSPFRQSDDVAELYGAIVDAFKTMGNVSTDSDANIPSKDGKAGYGYKYASLGAVMQMVRVPLADAGLAIVQAPSFEHGRNGQLITVATRLLHRSGQWMEASVTLTISSNAGAQAVGSALTYARRYGALSLLGIATSNDDDGRAAHDSRPGDYENQPDATVDKRYAQIEVLGAIATAVRGGEQLVEGWEPTDQEKDLARSFFGEFFKTDGPYSHATLTAVVKTVPQWIEGRTSQDPDDYPAQAPTEPVSAATDDEGPSDPPASSGRRTFTSAELDDLGVPEADIIAKVKAMKLDDVRSALAAELLSTSGSADTVRARLADHRIRNEALERLDARATDEAAEAANT